MRITPHDHYKYRAVVGAEVKQWHAYWLTSDRFYRATYRPYLAYNRRIEHATSDRNIHTLFRKNFQTKEHLKIKQALLYISGDDIYKVYLNSVFVGEGPAQSYPFDYYYNCYDVTDLLREGGLNAIGVHVYYQGLFNIYLLSADNAQGMIAQLEITYEDGSAQMVISDGSWKYTESQARIGKYIWGYTTQFSEDIDLNLWEDGWCEPAYDLSNWQNANVAGVPYPLHYTLHPQPTPPVKHEKIHPVAIKKIEDGFFIDFGKEYVGTIGLRVKGKKDDVIEIRCAEELQEDGRVRFHIRANCRYQEQINLTGKEDFVDFFDYKGFRYAEILHISALDPEDVWIFSRQYPVPDGEASFQSSDPLMNRVWEICAHGVKIGTQDTYYDCPTREKGGFLGDALITAPVHLLLTGDVRVFRKFLKDCINSARLFPGMICHVPTYNISTAVDYSLLVPLFLKEYYDYTGDADFIRQLMPAVDGMIDYYSQWENPYGLLEHIAPPKKNPENIDTFVLDWPRNLRDGYDFERAKQGVCTVINLQYFGAMKKTAEMYRILGDLPRAEAYEKRSQQVAKGLLATCYDYGTGLFLDAPDSNHSALHANALPLFYGLEPPKGYGPLVDLIMERRLNCGVYFAYFVIQGLYNIGEPEKAYDLLSGTDLHSWHNMVETGATACMEAWGPDQKWNTSWCHPWSSSPITFYSREILGIQCAAPAMKAIKVAPHIPDSVDSMALSYPVLHGRISASFQRVGDRIDYTISAPAETEVLFCDTPGIRFQRMP